MKRSTLILFSALALWGCDDGGPTAPSEVIGPTWQLVSLQDAGSSPVVVENPSRYTLRFEADGRLAVLSDCNQCGGRHELSGISIKVDSLQCTLVACPPGSLDGRYRQALERAQVWSKDDDELILQGGGVTLHFRN
jgi:heat shock protein HslJ